MILFAINGRQGLAKSRKGIQYICLVTELTLLICIHELSVQVAAVHGLPVTELYAVRFLLIISQFGKASSLRAYIERLVKQKKEVEEEEYNAFFKSTFKEFLDPVAHNHFNVEGTIEFSGMIFIPGTAGFDQSGDAVRGLRAGANGGADLEHVRRVVRGRGHAVRRVRRDGRGRAYAGLHRRGGKLLRQRREREPRLPRPVPL